MLATPHRELYSREGYRRADEEVLPKRPPSSGQKQRRQFPRCRARFLLSARNSCHDSTTIPSRALKLPILPHLRGRHFATPILPPLAGPPLRLSARHAVNFMLRRDTAHQTHRSFSSPNNSLRKISARRASAILRARKPGRFSRARRSTMRKFDELVVGLARRTRPRRQD